MFKRLKLPPGIDRESTEYAAEGAWFDSNNIRFRGLYPESIGGWEQDSTYILEGIGRDISAWSSYSGYEYICVATDWKFYVIYGGVAYDITPLRTTTTNSTTFDATNGSSVITVLDASHGATDNDFVTFSGVAAVGLGSGGNITKSVLEQEYQIYQVGTNDYKINAKDPTTGAAVTANTDDDEDGGASVDSAYQLNVGNTTPVSGSGWGLGGWGGAPPEDGLSASITGITNASPAVITANNTFVNGDSVYISGVLGMVNTSLAITGITKAAEAVVTAPNAFSDGDLVNIYGISGMTQLNENYYIVANSSASSFKIKDPSGSVYVDSSTYSAWTSGGTVISYLIGVNGTLNNPRYTVDSRSDTTFQIKDSDGVLVATTPAFSAGVTAGWTVWVAVPLPGALGTAETGRGWSDPADFSEDSVVVSDGIRLNYVDNYGEDLMIANKNGRIYYWDLSASSSLTTGIPDGDRALSLDDSSFTGNTGTPLVSGSFLISDRDGHCISFGSNDLGGTTKNDLLVRWSDQNNPFDWTPTATNTAGGQVLRVGTKILGGITARQEILVWTDAALYSMRYIGPPSTFSFNLVSGNVRIVSARSVVNVSSVIYFMGQDGFYVYTGTLSPLQSTVEKYVFDDINLEYNEKIFSGSNSSFNEVFWFYPSSGSIEPDRYVIYNYLDKVWSIGSFDMAPLETATSDTTSYGRTAWMDSSVFTNPRSTYVYSWDDTVEDGPDVEKTAVMVHETGSSANGSAMNCSIESGDMEISDGDRYSLLTRIFPDVKFFDTSEGISDPTLSIDVTAKDFPGSAESTISSVTVKHSMTTGLNGVGSVPPQGNATAIRGRGRAVSVKMSSSATTYKWRLGDTRIDMQPDGRR